MKSYSWWWQSAVRQWKSPNMKQIEVKRSLHWLIHGLQHVLLNCDCVHTTESSWPAHRKGVAIYFWLNFEFSVSTGGWSTYRQNKAVEGGCVRCVRGARWVRGSERGGGGGKTEGGWARAGVSTHHAPGISYLKFSRSAPQKNLPTLPTRTHQGACLRTHSFMKEATRETRMKFW